MFWKHLEIYIGYGLLITLIYESQVIVGIIHLVSSFLWWSITFVVVAIIRPANRSGVLSLIVYCNVVSGGKISAIIIKLNKMPKLANQIPIVFFSIITITLTFMVVI